MPTSIIKTTVMIISIYNRVIKKMFFARGKNAFAIFLLIVCSAFASIAQAQTVQGTITDETGKPVPSVSVLIKGTSQGTTANENGVFTISASPGAVLVISSVGFDTKEVTLGSES